MTKFHAMQATYIRTYMAGFHTGGGKLGFLDQIFKLLFSVGPGNEWHFVLPPPYETLHGVVTGGKYFTLHCMKPLDSVAWQLVPRVLFL